MLMKNTKKRTTRCSVYFEYHAATFYATADALGTVQQGMCELGVPARDGEKVRVVCFQAVASRQRGALRKVQHLLYGSAFIPGFAE